MKPVNMILFDKTEVKEVLELMNVKVEHGKLLNEAGDPIVCHTCGTKLTPKKLGNVMPGSIYFCDNPVCFAIYVSERYMTCRYTLNQKS